MSSDLIFGIVMTAGGWWIGYGVGKHQGIETGHIEVASGEVECELRHDGNWKCYEVYPPEEGQ